MIIILINYLNLCYNNKEDENEFKINIDKIIYNNLKELEFVRKIEYPVFIRWYP